MRNQSIGSLNSYQPKQLSKPLVILFSAIQLFLGMNHGFFINLNKNLKVIANLESGLILIVNLAVFWDPFNNTWYKIVTNVYCIWNFLVLHSSSYSIYNFLKEMMAIDAKWKLVVKDRHFTFKIFLYLLVWFFVTTSGSIYLIYYVKNESNWTNLRFFVSQQNILMVFIIVSIVNIMVYHHVYLRINNLKTMLEAKTIRTNDVLLIYQSLADCLAKIRSSQDKTVSQTFNTICFTAINYSALHRR